MTEKSIKALSIFKQIISELRLANNKNEIVWQENLQFLKTQIRDHKLTQKVFGKAPNEVEHLASCYATYLTSTRKLEEVQLRYAGKEKSIAESAKIVGLTLPQSQKS